MADVTVICAVWHEDQSREDLLRGHAENLARQSSVRSVYVFDGGDRPPGWLDAETIVSKSSLTIFEAWNLALAAVRTPFVMNLNLDDRLALGAVERLVVEIEATQSVLIGGEWHICYSQDETDKVEPCHSAFDVPFVASWPPAPGTTTRLGSGTGERGTYGPATLWRMAAHRKIPRYPWRFSDGTLIKAMGDSIFWFVLQQTGARLTRLPVVIGNYHSHPSGQAEFRWAGEGELAASRTIEII